MLRHVTFTILLAMLGCVALAPSADAQDPSCANILADQNLFVDTGRVIAAEGKPGDTIWVPISVRNTQVIGGFTFYLQWDTTWVRPLENPLFPTRYIWQPSSRLFVDSLQSDSLQIYIDQEDSVSGPNSVRMIVFGSPDFGNPGLLAEIGSGPLFSIGMYIPPDAPHNHQTLIDWYYEDVVDTTRPFPYPIVACKHSQYTDTVGNYKGSLNTFGGIFTVDTAATEGPVVNSFTANPTTIAPGGQTTLSWQTTNATTVSITGLSAPFALSGSRTVTLNSTTTFVLTATDNNDRESSAQVTVTVSSDPSNNNPVVSSISPSAYTITQGENVSFSVSATDADDDVITLTAQNLPANASFGSGGQVVGTGSVTGNFSFTPNTTQEGTYTIGFRATDDRGGASTVVNVSITVEKIAYDILFSKSRPGGATVGGLAGKRSVLFPIDLVTSQEVYGVQFDMFYDPDYFEIDSIITTNRTLDWVIYDNIGQFGVPPGEVRIMTFGMEGNPLAIDSTNSTTILYVAMTIDSTAFWGDYPVNFDNGWESNNPDPTYPSLQLVTDSAIIQVDRLGDVNLDQEVNVQDALGVVWTIIGNGTLDERRFDAADIILDTTIDVFDLVGVINTAFGLPVEQPQPASSSGSDLFATVALDYDDLFVGTSDELIVRSELPESEDIAGVQLNIRYDPGAVTLGKPTVGESAARQTLYYTDNGAGQMTVVMYYGGDYDRLITSKDADLVHIPITARSDVESGNESQLRLADVKLSSPTAKSIQVNGFGPTLPADFQLHQNYPNPFNPTTTIQFELSGPSQHVQLDIFNVLGQRVRTLLDKEMSSGEHSVLWDATTDNGSKVATGVYLYRLQVGDRSDTKKMLLLK